MSHISNLPLQEMLAGVVRSATEKLAAAEANGHREPWEEEEETSTQEEENAGLTDSSYVEKLASACDFLAENIDSIEAPNRGVLGSAIAKMAGEAMPPEASSAGALHAEAAMNGEQKYKKDKPKAGFDSAASEANTPTSAAELPGGATQLDNNMHSPPGGGSGKTPTKEYPKAGPLHAGPTKTAGTAAELLERLKGGGKKYLELAKDNKKALGVGAAGGAVLGGGTVAALKGGKEKKASCEKCGNVKCACMGKTAGELARQAILAKLAGEDVMTSNVSSSKSGGPLVGDGEMDAHKAEEVPSNPTDGSGYGNQQRGMVGSNDAAINYSKGDAKKPRAKELAEVLKNPAFSPKHDGKLHEQLQNAGQAGVKIAGAQRRELLKQAAASGKLTQEMVDRIKVASMEDGSDGCTCAGEGSCKVCKLKALKDESAKTSMTGMDAGGMGGGMGY
jgi:hypothetical protein